MPAIVLLGGAGPSVEPCLASIRQALEGTPAPGDDAQGGAIVLVPANAADRRDWIGAVFTQQQFELADRSREEPTYWWCRDLVRTLHPNARTCPLTVMFADHQDRLPEVPTDAALFVFVAAAWRPANAGLPHQEAWVVDGAVLDWVVGCDAGNCPPTSLVGPARRSLLAYRRLLGTVDQAAVVVDGYWASPAANVPWRACWPPMPVANAEACLGVVSLPGRVAGLREAGRQAGRRLVHAAAFNTLTRLSRLAAEERHLAARLPVAPLPAWVLRQVGLDGRTGVLVAHSDSEGRPWCCNCVVPGPDGNDGFDQVLLAAVRNCLAGAKSGPAPFYPRGLAVTLLAPTFTWQRVSLATAQARNRQAPGLCIGWGSLDPLLGWTGIVFVGQPPNSADLQQHGDASSAWLIRSDEIAFPPGTADTAKARGKCRAALAGGGTTNSEPNPTCKLDPNAAARRVRTRAGPRAAPRKGRRYGGSRPAKPKARARKRRRCG